MKVDVSGHTHPIPHSRVPDINSQQLGKSGSSNVGNFERSYLIKTLMEKEELVRKLFRVAALEIFQTLASLLTWNSGKYFTSRLMVYQTAVLWDNSCCKATCHPFDEVFWFSPMIQIEMSQQTPQELHEVIDFSRSQDPTKLVNHFLSSKCGTWQVCLQVLVKYVRSWRVAQSKDVNP